MLSSDFKAAIRNIFRNKVPSAISILGLGIGLGCIILLLALIIHEKSFDRHIPGYKNVYRITLGNIGQAPLPLAGKMKSEFPEVKDYFRYVQAMSVQIRTKDNAIIRESDFSFADSSIYRILGVKLISGKYASSPAEVAIARSAAGKFFGELSPIGLVLPVKFGDGFTPLTVSGVYDDFPSNSTLKPSFIADIKASEKIFAQWQRTLGDFGSVERVFSDWRFMEFLSYVVLEQNSNPEKVAEKMEKYKEFLTVEKKEEMHFRLQPVSEIYLHSEGISGNQYLRQGNPRELIYYEVISLLILIISLSNYVLLTRAGVAQRIFNLGTRKVFGASHAKIRRLIILESNLIVLISIIPATFIIDYGMELVNATLNKSLSPDVFRSPGVLLLLLSVVLLTGTLAGWLIGLHYSKVPALDLISGKARNGTHAKWNYSFLVLHFTIYMVFAAGILGVSKQIRYSQSAYRGINPENVMVSELASAELMSSFNTVRDEMQRVPGVIAVAGGTIIPPFGNYLPVTLATTEGDKIRFDGLIMGEGMTELLGIEIIDGTSFGPYKAGPPEVLINESTAKAQKVKAGENLLVFRVKGIVRDFNAHSLHTAIQPLV
ncbi:MAG TPA: ABC transporter permease, partial [Bacteroidales bacterium]|nr:ABC transporter permease [Bacteroidales bacterium]